MFTLCLIIKRLSLSIFAFVHRHATHSIVLLITPFHYVLHVLISNKCPRGSNLYYLSDIPTIFWSYCKFFILVCRYGFNIYMKKILRKKKNYGNSNISPCKNIIFRKKSFKINQTPSQYHNSIINLKFQHKPKISSFKKPHIKINLLHGGQNPLSYYTL